MHVPKRDANEGDNAWGGIELFVFGVVAGMAGGAIGDGSDDASGAAPSMLFFIILPRGFTQSNIPPS